MKKENLVIKLNSKMHHSVTMGYRQHFPDPQRFFCAPLPLLQGVQRTPSDQVMTHIQILIKINIFGESENRKYPKVITLFFTTDFY